MRLLYAMHVNWNWIRQRPHVLAEQLASNHAVELLHFRMFHSQHRAAEVPPPFTAHELQRLPERLKRLGRPLQVMNGAWLGHQVARRARSFGAEALWVTHPDLAPALRRLPSLPVIYDCMDDHAAFTEGGMQTVLTAERELLERADLVIFSSTTLAQRVRERASVGRSLVINNGVSGRLLAFPSLQIRQPPTSEGPILGYFGTISHWLDWPLVLEILEALPTARMLLAGPIEVPPPAHPRIVHVGVVPHAALADFVTKCDALIMPFIVNRLIRAVDPVKLYEYIAFGLPALAPRYPESERFAPWVGLYGDAEEALSLLRQPARLHDEAARRQFLARQTWEVRGAQVEEALRDLRARVPSTSVDQ